jgi:hypothetical protein
MLLFVALKTLKLKYEMPIYPTQNVHINKRKGTQTLISHCRYIYVVRNDNTLWLMRTSSVAKVTVPTPGAKICASKLVFILPLKRHFFIIRFEICIILFILFISSHKSRNEKFEIYIVIITDNNIMFY